jgi:hypothetical protein
MSETTTKHPYTSGSGGITATINQLRRSFPPSVTADTLKRLGIARNNETYIINILKFVKVLDSEGKKTPEASAAFSKHEDSEFQAALGALVEGAYRELFALHGEAAWALPSEKLISFFRNADQTSGIVGQRQASTFQALAGLCGRARTSVAVKAPRATVKVAGVPKAKKDIKASPADALSGGGGANAKNHPNGNQNGNGDVGLTVRIEVNLPAGGDKETYDAIFKSIRENLLSGK